MTSNKSALHKTYLDALHKTYLAKNADYGDSFGESIKTFGLVAGVVRISDKYHRLESLLRKGDAQVKDETLKDTLMDMANYCVMLAMEMEREVDGEIGGAPCD